MPALRNPPPQGKRRHLLLLLAGAYLALLAGSDLYRFTRRPPLPGPGPLLEVRAVDGARSIDRRVRIGYIDEGPHGGGSDTPVVLLHGSPGSKSDFRSVVPVLARHRRVLAPDLPGFGSSTRDVPDYSCLAHARYVLEMLDRLGIERVHLVGFSMGGGVALRVYDLAPDRVASVTLLSAIGVQELELFGDHRLNHMIHGGQLAAFWIAREALPHFGLLDGTFLGVPYARNFYDTDQRPLRGILRSFEPPMLIIHGRRDFLVPVEAALEHHRLVPQSELQLTSASHFMVFLDGAGMGRRIARFLGRVDLGQARRRRDADPARVAASGLPFDSGNAPPYTGFAMLLMVALLALATLVSEDLACIGAGLLVGHGRLDFVPAVVGCMVGIFVGDVLLFLAGRWLGRAAVRRAPLRWWIREEHVEASSRWLSRRGPLVIGLSRFVPGLRLPTYFTAGVLRTSFWRFMLYFLVAVVVWTPLLVGLSAWVGERAFGYFELFRRHALVALLLLALWILLLVKLVVPLFTFRGRRLLYGRLRRLWNWEFWPPWAFYPPVVAYAAWLGIKHRGMFVFTAANPAIPAGGFVAESKYRILRSLEAAGAPVARTELLPAGTGAEERLERVREFMRRHGLTYPVVLKPDAGQRGAGVLIARGEEAIARYLARARFDTLVQEYAPGDEFGIFYYRHPGDRHGTILSVTEKRIPLVHGDGRHTIEELILLDRRAVCLAESYLRQQSREPDRVPRPGEAVPLVELGTHCRGAVFLDGSGIVTSELERAVDEISRRYEGFYFGRYDVRAPDPERLRHGRGFLIIELNGVTSEATHIYDPRLGLFRAWRTLFEQWRIAYEIGSRNRAAGVRPASLGELVGLLRRYRDLARSHPS